jgi:hypothetical protein
MKFVEDVILERDSTPILIGPLKPIVNNLGGPVDPLWLMPGGGVRALFFTIQPIAVECSRDNALPDGMEISIADGFHGEEQVTWFYDVDVDLLYAGSPH